jgi:hypothetical protein
MLYNFWFSVGNFFAPLALKFMHDRTPHDYLTPIYTQVSLALLTVIESNTEVF